MISGEFLDWESLALLNRKSAELHKRHFEPDE